MNMMGLYSLLNAPGPDGNGDAFDVPDGVTTLRGLSFGGGGGFDVGDGYSTIGPHRSKHPPARRKLKRARKGRKRP